MSLEQTNIIAGRVARLKGLYAETTDNSMTIYWNRETQYKNQVVRYAMRHIDASFSLTETTNRDDGTVTLTGLDTGGQYVIWIRPEDSGYSGQWQGTIAEIVDGGGVGLVDVTYNADSVTHGGLPVTYPASEVGELPDEPDLPDPE